MVRVVHSEAIYGSVIAIVRRSNMPRHVSRVSRPTDVFMSGSPPDPNLNAHARNLFDDT